MWLQSQLVLHAHKQNATVLVGLERLQSLLTDALQPTQITHVGAKGSPRQHCDECRSQVRPFSEGWLHSTDAHRPSPPFCKQKVWWWILQLGDDRSPIAFSKGQVGKQALKPSVTLTVNETVAALLEHLSPNPDLSQCRWISLDILDSIDCAAARCTTNDYCMDCSDILHRGWSLSFTTVPPAGQHLLLFYHLLHEQAPEWLRLRLHVS